MRRMTVTTNARISTTEVMRRYGMRRNSVAFGIGLNMEEVERLRSYAITRTTRDTVDVLPARQGVARRGMSIRSHLQLRRTGSDYALPIQPVAALLTKLFQREVVIEECGSTAGASVAIF